MPVLGQRGLRPDQDVRPILGQSMAEWKAFVFHVMGYQIHSEPVRRFHLSTARTLIPIAPARTSKSYTAGHDVIPYCLPLDPICDSLHWIIGYDYSTNKEFDYIYEQLVEKREQFTLNGAPAYTVQRANNNPRHGDMEIVLDLGLDPKRVRRRAVVKGMSSQNEKSLQGEQVTTAVLSEAAEHAPHILSKYLSTRCYRIILPTTPKPYAEWLRDLCDQAGLESELGIETFEFPPESNPAYDWDLRRVEERKAGLRARSQMGPNATAQDDPYFAEQFLGRWVYYTGKALPFNAARHVIRRDAIDFTGSRYFVSVDYGYEDPASAGFWAVLPSGIVVRMAEIYERQLSTQAFVDRITDKVNALGIAIDHCTGDPSRPEVGRIMQEAGLPVYEMDKNAQRDRAAGHRRLTDLLTEGPFEGFPGLYVTEDCPKTISEWSTLHYKEGFRDEYGTTALKGADHAFDDTRYFLMSRPVPRAPAKPEDQIARFIRERQHEARMQSRSLHHAMIGTRRHAA